MAQFLSKFAHTIEDAQALDAPGAVVGSLAERVVRGSLKDALAGRWLGHALHPALTDVTAGCLTSSILLDLFGGESGRPGAETLAILTLLSAAPTALSGAADWMDTTGGEQRLGTAHAAINATALSILGASLVARRRGAHRTAVVLSLGAGALVSTSAWIGGHLVLARGVRVDRTAWEVLPEEWTRLAALADVPEGATRCLPLGDLKVLVHRAGDRVVAISNVCSHMGGPLNEGIFDKGSMQVTCPWHGSVFRAEDGAVVSGPAGAPQPAYDARVTGTDIEVRRRHEPN